ncbi:MAG: NAD(+)/NADH kinase [Chloroflexi bacterium]|nr:NAD(+)/NADH kinase [Chloroflexota bacterium]MCZ6790121.1 NAD(+)/NADH kinase [Chloroflexota bacterium]
MTSLMRIGFVHNQRVPGAFDLVKQVIERLKSCEEAWIRSAGELEQAHGGHPGVELIITVGGDGTILRAARIAAPHDIPILGINMGRVGFMTELAANLALDSVDAYLGDDVRIEERAMVQARILPPRAGAGEPKGSEPLHALNEVVIGNGGAARMVAIEVKIDGVPFTVYHADSVIVATATGSTGYALSAGGPILHPLSRDMLLKPVAAQLGFASALALPPGTAVELGVDSDHPTILSIDGFVEESLEEGSRVTVEASPYRARFLRRQPVEHYYATLTQKLGQR